jgi:hypothetical protein
VFYIFIMDVQHKMSSKGTKPRAFAVTSPNDTSSLVIVAAILVIVVLAALNTQSIVHGIGAGLF